MSKITALTDYDGTLLDGDESFPLVEPDDGETKEITVKQFFENAPFPSITSYDGDVLNGTEILPVYEDDEGVVEGMTTTQLFQNVPGDISSPGTVACLRLQADRLEDFDFILRDEGDPVIVTDADDNQNNTAVQVWADGEPGDSSAQLLVQFGTGNINAVEAYGTISGPTKNFVIDHPNPQKNDTHTLRHGSLEGPENGVYQRGTLDGSAVIDLPSYWSHLVDDTTITVNLTAVGGFQNLYVKSKSADQIEVGIDGGSASDIHCDYTVYAERKDVDPLVVEEEK